MNRADVKLAEAVALLASLASLTSPARGQVEVLNSPPGTRGPLYMLISADGEWTAALDYRAPGGAPVRWARGSTTPERLADYVHSGVILTRITTDGTILGASNLIPGSWTSVGFAPMADQRGSVRCATPDGEASIVRFAAPESEGTVLYVGGQPVLHYPVPAPYFSEWPRGISDDGRVVAATAQLPVGNYGTTAGVRWVDGVWRPLPETDPTHHVWVEGVSGDGNVVGGAYTIRYPGGTSAPVLWVGDSPAFILGGESYLTARPMSRDGRIVRLSEGYDANAIWTPWAGLRTVERFLTDSGLTPAEAALVGINECSADGTVFAAVRRTVNYPWVPLRITLPPPCPLDYATDGFIDFFDYLAFVDCFLGPRLNYRSADFNFDGFVDWTDYADFVDAFEVGC